MSTVNACSPQRSSRSDWDGRARSGALLSRAGLLALGALALLFGASTANARGNEAFGTLAIVNPKTLQGPAGTNVTSKIKAATPGHAFTIGYAPQTPGCLVGSTPISGMQPVTIQNDGTATFTFPWPAESGTGTFLICGQDTSNPLAIMQSPSPFNVLSTTPPSISIQPAVTSTPGGASSTPGATGPGGNYFPGEQVDVQGASFLPGGTPVNIYLGTSDSDLGAKISTQSTNAGTDGSFNTVVTLPAFRAGQLYIQAASNDGGNGIPPALYASQPINVVLAPTPTAQPSPTESPSPTPAVVPTATPGHNGSGGDIGHVIGAVGLGALSIVLLAVGAYLLVSAAGGRPQG